MGNAGTGITMPHTIKDSVFCDLFSRPRYALELYGALHPEDGEARERDVEVVTRRCVVARHPYNDLGLAVAGRLLVMVEAQSAWSENIALRSLLYVGDTLRDWLHTHELDPYRPEALALPRPELYVIYSGSDRAQVPDEVLLSGTSFGGSGDVEAVVHVLRRGPRESDIISQYVDFTHVIDAARRRLGRSVQALRAAIRECIGRGILSEYLLERETEVIDMMSVLYDAEEVQRNMLRHARREAIEEGHAEGRAEGRAEGERRLGRLMDALLDAHRLEDARRASTDPAARAELYAELGIE